MPEQELRQWFGQCPNWLQKVAQQILQEKRYDLDELTEVCIQEILGNFTKTDFLLPGQLFQRGSSNIIRLSSIQDIQNINALSPTKPLQFGDENIAVIYGLNGSGKSGYVRILKHVCGARDLGLLHQNIFFDIPKEQMCVLTYKMNGTDISTEWTPTLGVLTNLCEVNIFDTLCGRIYVVSENEVSYEPPILSFFSDLIKICEDVSSKIDQRLKLLTSTKPELPKEYFNTQIGNWFNSISSKTSLEEINSNCEWDDKSQTELNDIQTRLSEQSPKERAKRFRNQKKHLDNLLTSLDSKITALSDEDCQKILDLRHQITNKKETSTLAAEKLFQDEPLDGVGTDIWKNLWEAARQYSEKQAYIELSFPNTQESARCVLCQQSLSIEAKERFQSFETFVKGTLETEIIQAEEQLQVALEALPHYLSNDELRTTFDACGWPDEKEREQLITIYSGLRRRHEELLRVSTLDELSDLNDLITLDELVKQGKMQSEKLEENALTFDGDTVDDKRAELHEKQLEFQGKKWVYLQKESIKNEVERLKRIDLLNDAKRLTNTTSLSRKKGELAKSLITEAYVSRFNDELKRLNAERLRVEIASCGVSKGRVLHKIHLCCPRCCNPLEILSEGESRIIALAAFLADITNKGNTTPVVLDDPISSLDQEYEEAVVKRLVDLANDRQVIIFTHRLSLLGLVQDYGKQADIEANIICLRKEEWGTGEPGYTPLFAKKPEKVLNAMLNERLEKGKKILQEFGREDYDQIAKALCRDFRILIERMIESILLSGVVQRYRRSVNTMGKISRLAHISDGDCNLFDSLMTKYSRYEHSQPDEAPIQMPLPEELKQDFERLKQWYEEFIKRGN